MRHKPVIVACALDIVQMTMAQIDGAVSAQLARGKSLYKVGETKLHAAAPHLLVTQNLCQACGPSGNEVSQVIRSLIEPPKILWQTPRNFAEVLEAVRALGRETGTEAKADQWTATATARIERVSRITREIPKTRVEFLEWVDPLYCGGHWVPQMLECAGAEDANLRAGTESVRISWQQVLEFRPEILLISPCGFMTRHALDQAELLKSRPGWLELPAVRSKRVNAVDANSYFTRPGPRLIYGVELLAHLVHPGEFFMGSPRDAYSAISV